MLKVTIYVTKLFKNLAWILIIVIALNIFINMIFFIADIFFKFKKLIETLIYKIRLLLTKKKLKRQLTLQRVNTEIIKMIDKEGPINISDLTLLQIVFQLFNIIVTKLRTLFLLG